MCSCSLGGGVAMNVELVCEVTAWVSWWKIHVGFRVEHSHDREIYDARSFVFRVIRDVRLARAPMTMPSIFVGVLTE